MKPAYFNFLSIAILLILIIISSYLLWHQTNSQLQSPMPRPDFSLPDVQGRLRSSSEWEGQVVVVNFWATWCPPCVREIPHFIRLQQRYADKGLQFVGIAVDHPVAVKEFVNQININYPILVDTEDQSQAIAIAQKFGNHYGALPFTVIIDRQNMIIRRYPGELKPQTLEEIILPLF